MAIPFLASLARAAAAAARVGRLGGGGGGGGIQISSNANEVARALRDLERRIPAAAARAINNTAKAVRDEEKKEIASVFDRPTPYVQNSPRAFFASTSAPALEASVRIMGGSARALEAEIQGGGRKPKPFEIVMRRARVIPSGKYAVPGAGAKIDRHGNMDGDQLAAILKMLGVLSQQSQGRRQTKKRQKFFGEAASSYFVAKNQNGEALGIFMRKGRLVRPVLHFVNQPGYARRFDFFGKGQEVINRTLPGEIRTQMDRALASVRGGPLP